MARTSNLPEVTSLGSAGHWSPSSWPDAGHLCTRLGVSPGRHQVGLSLPLSGTQWALQKDALAGWTPLTILYEETDTQRGVILATDETLRPEGRKGAIITPSRAPEPDQSPCSESPPHTDNSLPRSNAAGLETGGMWVEFEQLFT